MISGTRPSPEDIMYLISSISTDAEPADDVLRKVRGDNGQELTIQQALQMIGKGKKLAHKIGFKDGDIGIVVNGRVRQISQVI